MNQESIFAQSEANSWFQRNLNALLQKDPQRDPIFEFLSDKHKELNLRTVLEVGCSNGYRLSWLKNLGLHITGFDPSTEAVNDGRQRYGLSVEEIFVPKKLEEIWHSGQLKSILKQKVDCIAFAHCLYLIPPSQYAAIVATALELLNEGGIVLIFDFDSVAHRQKYHHLESGVWSYKMHFENMFTWLPYMKLIHKRMMHHGGGTATGNPKEDCAFVAIRKCDIDLGFPQLL